MISGITTRVIQSGGSVTSAQLKPDSRGESLHMGRRVLLALLSAAVLVGLMAQPGAAVNVPQAVVVSSNPANWTPHVLNGKVAAIVQVGNKIVAGGQFTQVASAAAPTTAIARSNIFAFDATTGAIDTAFAPVLDAQVESLAVAPDGLHVFAGGSFTKINGVAQKGLVKLRLSDGARITAFKGKTNARVKDMAVSGGRLYIGGTFTTVDGVTRTALAAVDPVTGALDQRRQPGLHRPPHRHRRRSTKFDVTPDGSRLDRHRQLHHGRRPRSATRSSCSTSRPRPASRRPTGRPTRFQRQLRRRVRHLHARRRLLARRLVLRGRDHRRLPRPAACATPPPAGRRRRPARPAADLGRLHRRRHRCTPSPSPAPRSTSAATSAG